jgi:hypothetical protein
MDWRGERYRLSLVAGTWFEHLLTRIIYKAVLVLMLSPLSELSTALLHRMRCHSQGLMVVAMAWMHLLRLVLSSRVAGELL